LESKNLIGQNLNKSVNYCCWPHGDYNDLSQKIAEQVGYKGTTIVLKGGEQRPENRFNRTGLYHVRKNKFLSMLKARYRIGAFEGRNPWKSIEKVYGRIKGD
jgi:hypothetical protein